MNPILRFILFALGCILLLVGLLAGGCSAFFTPDILKGGDYIEAVQMVWAIGLIVAAAGIGLGVWILRRLTRPAPAKAFDAERPE
ncbi:hypothetical protein NX862_02090 [Rhodobacter sp. KR11]|uniref:hypothetical protein n=1 Tax=Rhodobacter sp. KR11 TaxID=2974588 RepID=UPI0022213A2B|nr:hypothetical protein [Rhodobacter sp. KR11]MCW1917535.1 hypothetical protein [Rhodobacter sp. KR11]